MIRDEIKKAIENTQTYKELDKECKSKNFELDVNVEGSSRSEFGDYTVIIQYIEERKILKTSIGDVPQELGTRPSPEKYNEIIQELKKIDFVEKAEFKEPIFINIFLKEECLQNQVGEILKQKEKFGQKIYPVKSRKAGPPSAEFNRVNVEFISANPTGPLTLGNGRGGFCGDVLANVLEKAGYDVTREYYINDRGEQIIKLGHSVLGDSQAVYKGDYIDNLRKKLCGDKIPANSVEEVGERAAEIILKEIIKPAIKRIGIKFDVWFSEKDLYDKGAVDNVIKELSEKGFTYESEKAVWFKSKELGDDKDRVLVRTDGIKTYFASDIAYLKDKIKRGFGKIIIFLGADHYGYVARLKAAIEALGFGKENLDAIVMQLVRLFQDGKELRMSKRTGTYIALEELIDEVGLDIARFFFLTRSPDTHLNFNMNLAKEQSAKNPVYYVQYAHARICNIIKKTGVFLRLAKPNFELLKEPVELELIKQLIRFPEIIEDTTIDFQVQRIPQYAIELADSFHKFYENCRVIGKDKKISRARLGLVLATKIVLKNTLDLMRISAPGKM